MKCVAMKRHLRVLIFAWARLPYSFLRQLVQKAAEAHPQHPRSRQKSLTFPQAASMPTGASTPGARHPGLDGHPARRRGFKEG